VSVSRCGHCTYIESLGKRFPECPVGEEGNRESDYPAQGPHSRCQETACVKPGVRSGGSKHLVRAERCRLGGIQKVSLFPVDD